MLLKTPQDIRILFVDDEKDFRDVLSSSFKKQGYQVFTACNGHEAFDLIKTQGIDVVVTDVRMPGGDGIELLDRVKGIRPETPIILLMSGFTDMSTEEAYNKGAEALFSKPFDRRLIQDTIERLLTPASERWSRVSDRADVPLEVELLFQGLHEAVAAKVVNLGRGGMFVNLKHEILPNVTDAVAFKVIFRGDESSFCGNGVVRWVRTGGGSSMPSGCGIEFTYLNEKDRMKVLELVNASRPKAFIPSGKE